MPDESKKDSVVAILPFQILSEERGIDHLLHGFVEDLITDLSRFGLSVISSHSSRLYSSENEREFIEKLQVDFYIKGSFRLSGSKVRISIQLIESKNDEIVFAGRHDENLDNLINLQDDVTQQIVNVLDKQITLHKSEVAKSKPPSKLAAYDYYLRGMDELKSGKLENDLKARNFFEQSLAIDPTYARAYTGLSLSYFNEWSCQLWSRWDVSKNGAQENALNSTELNPNEYRALAVLGRTYLYDGEYTKAENSLRKSLRLNPNDSDNLALIASCFIYLGFPEEAEKLYLKAIKLNPFREDWYYSTGSIIYFEKGEFNKALEIGNLVTSKATWVDYQAYQGAIHYHLGDNEKALSNWKDYLEEFRLKISKTDTVDEQKALDWFININPYKGETNLVPFWEFIKKQKDLSSTSTREKSILGNSFLKNQDIWQISFAGEAISLKDSKGLNDIHKMVMEPSMSFHCTELMGTILVNRDEVDHLDLSARNDYQKKIRLLQEELQEAELQHDIERASRLNEEYEMLLDHLSKSLALSGKSRKMGSTIDKTRSAVTWRIRSAIKKITEHHPELGDHLTQSIKTGILCSYDPKSPINWMA